MFTVQPPPIYFRLSDVLRLVKQKVVAMIQFGVAFLGRFCYIIIFVALG